MRKVLKNSDEVMHVWAAQSQEEGRSGNVFFEGERIYSYGHHFEMARHINSKVVFITNRTYSVTTSGHLSSVRYAVNHKKCFTVPTFDNHTENLEFLLDEVTAAAIKAKRARKCADYWVGAITIRQNLAIDYAAEFPESLKKASKDLKAKYEDITTGKGLEELIAKAAEATKRAKEAEKKKEADKLKKELVDLELWKQGRLSHAYFHAVALRVKGNNVETTKGAVVPVREARMLYRAIQLGKDVVGQRIGHFTVTSVNAETLVIGCHRIPMSEVNRIAPEVIAWKQVEEEVEAL